MRTRCSRCTREWICAGITDVPSTRAFHIVQRTLGSTLTACNDAECAIDLEDHRVHILDVADASLADRLVHSGLGDVMATHRTRHELPVIEQQNGRALRERTE